jgi:multicomponent K+:H+ antiporter subunit G
MTLTLPLWADALAAVLLVIGAGFTLVGSIGLARLSDFFKRLHGPSKATTLGVGCVLAASALVSSVAGAPSLHELLITLFLFLTAPVSAHLLVQLALKARPDLRPPVPPSPAQPAPSVRPPGAESP